MELTGVKTNLVPEVCEKIFELIEKGIEPQTSSELQEYEGAYWWVYRDLDGNYQYEEFECVPDANSVPELVVHITEDDLEMDLASILAKYTKLSHAEKAPIHSKLLNEMTEAAIKEGWKLFCHEHPSNNTEIDIIYNTGEIERSIVFNQKYLYKNGHALGACATCRFWRESDAE